MRVTYKLQHNQKYRAAENKCDRCRSFYKKKWMHTKGVITPN